MTSTSRLHNEGVKPYAAFKAYLAMGDQRSLAAVGQKLGKSTTLMSEWSSRYGWQQRVAAAQVEEHDAEMAAMAQAKLERARRVEARQEEVREEEWLLHQEMILKGREMLQQPMGTSNPSHATKLLEGGSMLGRMSAEMPTSRAALTGKGGKPLNSDLPTPIIKIVIKRDAASDALRDKFGPRPKSRGG